MSHTPPKPVKPTATTPSPLTLSCQSENCGKCKSLHHHWETHQDITMLPTVSTPSEAAVLHQSKGCSPESPCKLVRHTRHSRGEKWWTITLLVALIFLSLCQPSESVDLGLFLECGNGDVQLPSMTEEQKREHLYRCLRAQDTLTAADARPPRRGSSEPIANTLWRYTRNAIVALAQCAIENASQLPGVRRDAIDTSKPAFQVRNKPPVRVLGSQHMLGIPDHITSRKKTVRQLSGDCISCIAEEKNFCATRTTNRVGVDWGYDCLVCMNGGSPSDACTCYRHLKAGKGAVNAVVEIAGNLDQWYRDDNPNFNAAQERAAMLWRILCKIEGCY